MQRTHTATAKQAIPEDVLQRAIKRLKGAGFTFKTERQARYMIAETTEVVNALGGRIDWSG